MSQIINPYELNTFAQKSLDSGLAGQVVFAVNSYIERETGRCWGETRTVTERYDWRPTLWLRNMDVTAIASVALGYPGQAQTTLSASSYFFNETGRVTLSYGDPRGPAARQRDYVSVTYTYGAARVPEDLNQAALAVALSMYNWALAGGHEVVETSVGSYKVKYAGAANGASGSGPTPYNNAAELHFLTIKGYAKQRV